MRGGVTKHVFQRSRCAERCLCSSSKAKRRGLALGGRPGQSQLEGLGLAPGQTGSQKSRPFSPIHSNLMLAKLKLLPWLADCHVHLLGWAERRLHRRGLERTWQRRRQWRFHTTSLGRWRLQFNFGSDEERRLVRQRRHFHNIHSRGR